MRSVKSSENASAASDFDVVRSTWAAIAQQDLDAVLSVFDPQVRWHGAGDGELDEGCRDRDDVLTFLQRAQAVGVSAELLDLHPAGDHLLAVVQKHVPPDWGEQPDPHGELVTVREGRIVEMRVYSTVPDALAAARGPGSTAVG